MKQRFYLLLLLCFVPGACDKEEVPDYTFETTAGKVVLQGTAGATATFTVTASADWTAAATGTGYTFSPASGAAGETTLTVTASAENGSLRRADLGSLVIRIGGTEADRTIRVVQAPAKASQTLLVFLGGMGNLTSAFDRNISNALKAIGPDIPGDGRILVFRQTATNSARISELTYDPETRSAVQEVLREYHEELSSTDGPTVTRVLSDMLALAPAGQYMLMMGSHATAWVPASSPTIRFAVSDPYWRKSDGVPETRGFGYDNGRTMEIETLASAIEATKAKFGFLIFDACFMSSVEALYDLRSTADRIIASPCEIMLYGFPYDAVLPHMFTDGGHACDTQAICEGFYNFYATTTATEKSGCIALTECAELEALAQVVRRIHAAGLKTYDPEALQIYEGLSPHLFYDLGDFITAACADDGLLAAFKTQFDRTFPPACRFHTPTFYTGYGGRHIAVERYSGVSVSEPSTRYGSENKATAWYRATHE